MLSAEQIARAEAVSLADIAIERGLVLKKCGRELVGGCPHCAGRDRFAISTTENVWNCRGCGGKGRGAIAFVRWLDACGFRDAVETLIGERQKPRSNTYAPVPAKNSADDAAERAQKVKSAGRIWRASIDPRGTLAEEYLNGRGLDLPDDLRGRVLRFHPACPWGSDTVPALIAAFHAINEPDDDALPVAIMRGGLNADGTKIAKGKMLAPVAGSAIKLDADENVSHGLGIAEGLETAMKVRARGWHPIWVLGSAGAIERFAPLAGVEALTIFADNDESGRGIAAARTCAERWADAGLETFIRTPHRTGADWADII